MDYLIETKHTGKQCLAALEEIVEYKPEFLEKVQFGCPSGVHIGWAEVDADSESEALKNIPGTLRGDSRAVKVGKFSVDQIRGMHQ